jgi:MFS transporter, PPP family, 3-phenylpropionic acid transporter
LIDSFGLAIIIVASSAFFLVMTVGAMRVSDAVEVPDGPKADTGSLVELWRIGIYRRLLVVAFLVVGSHALNDAFAVIQWRAAGYDSVAVSLLWSEAVLAEVLVFFLLGPWLVARLGLAGSAAVSAIAGCLRWGVMASTTAMPALVVVQAFHGLTFALMHLAAMGVLASCIPGRLAATAQTVYGNCALGIASATMTLASGYLYGWFGLGAFWAMSACCALAVPLAWSLRLRSN